MLPISKSLLAESRSRRLLIIGLSILLLTLGSASKSAAQVLSPGFSIEHITSTISLPVAIAITPDGRAFISEKASGAIYVIKNDVKLAQPFVDETVNWAQERGGLGVAIDPDFENNQYVYYFFTQSSTDEDNREKDSVTVNRLLRYTASGDTALAGSAVELKTFPIVPSSATHNGGNIHFGPDDTLYVSVGDGMQENPPLAQDLSDIRGKIIRIDPSTGDAAPGNMFAKDGDPNTLGEIYSYGHRNPFDFDFHPVTGEIFSSENGPNSSDEVNHIVEGGNYGWNLVFGMADTPAESAFVDTTPNYVDPLWDSLSPTVCPTGIVMIPAASDWGAVIGECILFAECKPPFRIYKLPLSGTTEEPVVGTLEVFVDSFPTRLIDLTFDPEGRLWISAWQNIWRMTVDGAVSVDDPSVGALFLTLGSANPTNGASTIRYRIKDGAPARMSVFDARGRLVKNLVRARHGPGQFQAFWNGRDRFGRSVPSGIYNVVLWQGEERRTMRIVQLR